MSAPLCLALLTIILSVEGSDKLQIAFCTPENSLCPLASDGRLDTCFNASHLQENFYFAIFNTVGQQVTVDKLLLKVDGGGGRSHRTKYIVSLASGSEAHDLNCSSADGSPAPDGGRTMECPAGLHNVTSMMVRSEPLLTRLNLLEVAAFDANGTRVNFTYCVAPEADTCEAAMDHRTTSDSPAVVSQPTQFPSWYGGVPGTESIRTVKIYRPAATAAESAATFFRVHASADCEKVGQSAEAGGVEVLEFQCNGEPVNLLQVWEIDSEFLISLCEVEVYGE